MHVCTCLSPVSWHDPFTLLWSRGPRRQLKCVWLLGTIQADADQTFHTHLWCLLMKRSPPKTGTCFILLHTLGVSARSLSEYFWWTLLLLSRVLFS